MRVSVDNAELLRTAGFALRDAHTHTAQMRQLFDRGDSSVSPQHTDDELKRIYANLNALTRHFPEFKNEVEGLKTVIGEIHRSETGAAGASTNKNQTSGVVGTPQGASGTDDRFTRVEEQFDRLTASFESRQHIQDGVTNDQIDSIVELGIGYALVSLLLILGGLVLTYRKINAPLNRLAKAMRDIVAGQQDLTRRLNVHSKDEFSGVAEDFNQLIQHIQGILVQATDILIA